MASCITSQWKAYAPQAKLTVNIKSQTDTQAVLEYTLQYIASSAAQTNNIARAYTIKIGSNTINGSYDIDNKKGTYTVKTGTVTIDKTTAAQTIAFSVSFAFNLTWTGVYKGTLSASSSISVAAKTSYTISYNANGGSGAPSAQTKWAGTALTLSSTKPTRTGYAFQGWATSASGGVAYASGASYTANAAVTLYAVWKAYTYPVTYNANGGTEAPGNQTKTHGVALQLSSTKPKRDNYNFLGWATSASGAVVYSAGASYTANIAVTLYAVWELAYIAPSIYNLNVARCDASGVESDEGTSLKVAFDWETFTGYIGEEVSLELVWTDKEGVERSDLSEGYYEQMGASSGHFECIYTPYNAPIIADITYNLSVTLLDNSYSEEKPNFFTTVNVNQPSAAFPIDAVKTDEGVGVAFGKAAEKVGVAEFEFEAQFNKPVSGNVLGLNRLPAIPEGAELNDYMQTGAWAIRSNAVAATITCGGVLLGTDDSVPPARACRFEVNSSTGEGIRAEQWSYLRQRMIPYNDANPIYERDIARGDDNIWRQYDWWKSTLTPAASKKIYDKAAITIGLNTDTTIGVLNAYTKIPLDTKILSTSDRLTLTNNAVRIGEDIQYIKVSGQTLVRCGTVNGNRHLRIQRVRNGTVTSVAWVCIYGTATRNTLFSFAPIILSVSEGDLIQFVYYTGDTADVNVSGSSANGRQTYLTVEEL